MGINRLKHLSFYNRALRYRFKLDSAEIRCMGRHVSPGDLVIDIGAHKGGYLFWLRRAVGPSGRVLAFEPQRRLANYLKGVVDAMGWKNVSVEHAGLSSTEGELELFVPGGQPSPGATFVEGLKKRDEGTFDTVRVHTLDRYLADSGIQQQVRFIKCDVEGHELEVFRGGEHILREHRPAILFECEAQHHPGGSMDDVFQWLAELGYVGYFILDRAILPLTDFDASIHQVIDRKPYSNNFLFFPSNDITP